QSFQRVEARRLLHEVIEARRTPIDVALTPSGKADEPARSEIDTRLQRADQLVAADIRKADIDDGDGRLERIDRGKRFAAAPGRRDLAAAVLQQQAKQRAAVAVVVDDENPSGEVPVFAGGGSFRRARAQGARAPRSG